MTTTIIIIDDDDDGNDDGDDEILYEYLNIITSLLLFLQLCFGAFVLVLSIQCVISCR